METATSVILPVNIAIIHLPIVLSVSLAISRSPLIGEPALSVLNLVWSAKASLNAPAASQAPT